ncbi:hypothetical protein JCM12298_02980 [Desulfothermus naphthae]
MVKFLSLESIPKAKINTSGDWLFGKIFLDRFDLKLRNKKYLYPIIVEEKQNYFDLIWGYEILQEFKQDKINVIVVKANDFFKGLINLEFLKYEFKNSGKIIVCARYFDKILEKKDKTVRFFDIFENILNKKEINLLLQWLKLPEIFDEILIKDNVSLDVIEVFKKFTQNEQRYLLPFFINIRWGKNKSKIFLELLYKLKKREKVDIEIILNPLFEILEKDLSPNDKIQKILNNLRDRCYPLKRTIEKEFLQWSSKIINKKRIRIIPANEFEVDEIIMEIKLDGLYTLKNLVEDLKTKIDEWDRFYNWYKSRLNGE